ncbi:hypothetical protein [Selenomonas sputigena]|uniref:Uncharacterized protein n=1 Tax=Selenomonas sputigena (strain ATCC 35185 / DSM 20758 / CCUG 44933 / VPI D19B-28) TaxID=546271 RepID=C9LUV0_SELS3|nr:hypothetical protein [Selenomonas sputigena]AEC01176.1 hypothetical protein Selsp_2230 [Selenomonas sputigena ATCC 35185]EEX77366.1 hypothetical protein SELSPUOL_01240 [Selenomonas sputigena ATCC 35185]
MENCVDVKSLYELLNDAERRLEDAAQEMRLLLEDVEQKALPEEDAMGALRDSLKEISAMRTELAAKGAALDAAPASFAIADWRRALSAYEEKCANEAGREALALLQRLYSEDEECQSAIETLRASCPSLEADALGRKKPDLLRDIKLLMEAFQQEKPMKPESKLLQYGRKLARFPEKLVIAAATGDPPLLLHEQEESAPATLTAEEADVPKAHGKAARKEDTPHAAEEDGAPVRAASFAADVSAKEAQDERIATTLFERIREKYATEHPLLEIEDHSAEKKPTAKTIKNYLKQGTAAIGYLRILSMLAGIETMFTASWIEAEAKKNDALAHSVLADMVERGFLRLLHFRDLPDMYDVPASLYPELSAKEVLRLLHWKKKPPQPLEKTIDPLALEALSDLLHEQGCLHSDRRKGALHKGGTNWCGAEGYFLLTSRTALREDHYIFVAAPPTVKWLEKVRAARRKAPESALYLLGADAQHIEEIRAFLEEHCESALKIAGTYVWEEDVWQETSADEAKVRAEGAGNASIEKNAPKEETTADSLQEPKSASADARGAGDEEALGEGAASGEMPTMEAASARVQLVTETPTADAATIAAEPMQPTATESTTARPMAEDAASAAQEMPTVAIPPVGEPSAEEAASAPAKAAALPGASAIMKGISVEQNLHAMLECGDFASASAYLHAAAHFAPDLWKQLNQELAYALFAPLQKVRYSSDVLTDVYFTQSMGEPHEGLAVSAMLWNFYLDHTSYDYGMQSLLGTAKSFDLLKEAAGLSDALYTLMQFKTEAQSGADKYADYRLKDKSRMEGHLKDLQTKAREYEGRFVHGHITETGSNRRFIETQKLIFAPDGNLANALHSVAEGEREMFDLVRDYVAEAFLQDPEEGAPPFEMQNVSMDKINRLIDDCWHRAGSLVLLQRRSDRLIGNYRSSLQKRLEKIAVLLTQWVKCSDALGIDEMNSSLPAYRKMHGRLLEQLEKAQESIQETALPAWERQVLSHTIGEIVRRLRGDYEEKEQRFFYADFLRTPYVLLDEDFLPRVTQPVGDLENFFPLRRIEQHFAAEKPAFAVRLQEILDGSDDLGSARLIVSYLDATGEPPAPEVRAMIERMEPDSIIAHARRVKKEFIESLELAQSYGQIESAIEDKKEKILETVEVWFVRCQENLDYGFFAAIVEAFKKKIDDDAEHRGKALRTELDKLQTALPPAADEEESERREAKIEKIRRMIDIKNYTVTEDMLHRFGEDADDSPLESLQTDELRDFLRFYDSSYNKVYGSSRTLSSVVHLRGRNKETRGGEALLNAWPKSGRGANQSAMIKELLRGLGFSVASVKALSPIGKTENYEVLLEEAAGGRRNYAHPFAAFGSRATQTPFRVICLYGKFDADALIDRFKEIGTAKPTLVFLDYALQKDQRNRLARKTKLEIPECCFAVIDRVVIGYLAEHYAETKINRMTLSITMPYAFYQPYIPNAANAMPPEMFMGRKEALDKIVNPQGENIVYGGRQLGKSALLRMAEYTVNRMGDGSRALMVDVKSCNVEEAALRISREFADSKILAADFETRDWTELARAIRLRLNETSERIPYLLLLIDEADAFIESCKAVDYRPFEELKNIQTIGQERFKFVIAGLRNVVRFDKEALSKNSVLAHLKSYTVRPFSATEARELLEVPLACLGLRFSEEKQALVSTILATTNYFPGLIQLYCYKLLEAMKKDYAGYEEANTPPYEINEKHIKKVLAEADFMQDIYNKFDITLRVDEDCYYHILAILMADLYHDGENSEGCLPKDLLKRGKDYGIKKMEVLSLENVHALMEELRELNIFRLTAGGRYLFARYNFFQLMGSKEHLENELLTYMED